MKSDLKPRSISWYVVRYVNGDYGGKILERRGPFDSREAARLKACEMFGIDPERPFAFTDYYMENDVKIDEIREAPIADVVSIEDLLGSDEGSSLRYLVADDAEGMSRALGRALNEVIFEFFDRTIDIYLVDSKGEIIEYDSDYWRNLKWRPRISKRVREEIAAETERIEVEAKAKMNAAVVAILRKSDLRLPRKVIKWEDLGSMEEE